MIEKLKKLFHITSEEPTAALFEEKMSKLFDSLKVDELSIFLGSDLTKYYENLGKDIWKLRERIKDNTGLIIPPVRIKNKDSLQENEYEICIREKVVFNDFCVQNNKSLNNEILYNLELICKENIDEIISCETVEKYINFVQAKNKWLIAEIWNFFYTIEIKNILLGLVKNNCSIKDINFVFEQLAQYTRVTNREKIISLISPSLPKFKWDIQKYEYPKYNLEKLFYAN